MSNLEQSGNAPSEDTLEGNEQNITSLARFELEVEIKLPSPLKAEELDKMALVVESRVAPILLDIFGGVVQTQVQLIANEPIREVTIIPNMEKIQTYAKRFERRRIRNGLIALGYLIISIAVGLASMAYLFNFLSHR